LNAETPEVIFENRFRFPTPRPSRPILRTQGISDMATEDARKLFVAGLPESMSEDALRRLFEETGGKVVDVSLPRDRATGKVRGFGFVTFSTADEANRARDALDGSLQGGRSISVRPFSSEPPRREGGDFRGRESHPPGPPSVGGGGPPGGGGGGPPGGGEDRTLYVGNLPYDTTQQELTQVFGDLGVGPVARIHLPSGPDGRLRGFGFVTLGSAEAANAAIVSLRNADVRGRRLMVNIAHPRGAPGSGGGGGFSDRPSYGPRPTEPRFPTEPPLAFENRPASERRGPARPGGETDWAEADKKKKKKGKGGGAATSREPRGAARERGGGSNWQTWGDPDDDK
jgi:nucleolin